MLQRSGAGDSESSGEPPEVLIAMQVRRKPPHPAGSPPGTLREGLRPTGVRNRDGNRQDCDPLTAFGVYRLLWATQWLPCFFLVPSP
ncbi:hypothetical protein [Chlorogloeopsis fritschii]|uniref:hypothetical protein n=1 Tax=Chlorogloeopsis fritschii TaxID=1124 RepID=UPI000F8D2611|nr:hypothetical protein [Chlorogloeopsis fritschii]